MVFIFTSLYAEGHGSPRLFVNDPLMDSHGTVAIIRERKVTSGRSENLVHNAFVLGYVPRSVRIAKASKGNNFPTRALNSSPPFSQGFCPGFEPGSRCHQVEIATTKLRNSHQLALLCSRVLMCSRIALPATQQSNEGQGRG